jgi:hypothetical protein
MHGRKSLLEMSVLWYKEKEKERERVMSSVPEQASRLCRFASLISRSWIVSGFEVADNSRVGQRQSCDQIGEGPLRAGSFLEGQPTNRPSR